MPYALLKSCEKCDGDLNPQYDDIASMLFDLSLRISSLAYFNLNNI